MSKYYVGQKLKRIGSEEVREIEHILKYESGSLGFIFRDSCIVYREIELEMCWDRFEVDQKKYELVTDLVYYSYCFDSSSDMFDNPLYTGYIKISLCEKYEAMHEKLKYEMNSGKTYKITIEEIADENKND